MKIILKHDIVYKIIKQYLIDCLNLGILPKAYDPNTQEWSITLDNSYTLAVRCEVVDKAEKEE